MGSYQEIWDICDRCEAQPASLTLHEQLIAAINEVDDSEGAAIVVGDRLLGMGQPAAIRVLIANQLMDVAATAKALPWLDGDDPELVLARTECLVLLDRFDEAERLYAELRRSNPELRSPLTEHHLRQQDRRPS